MTCARPWPRSAGHKKKIMAKTKNVLGNDPFQRGAAQRSGVPQEVPPPKPARAKPPGAKKKPARVTTRPSPPASPEPIAPAAADSPAPALPAAPLAIAASPSTSDRTPRPRHATGLLNLARAVFSGALEAGAAERARNLATGAFSVVGPSGKVFKTTGFDCAKCHRRAPPRGAS